MIIIRWKEGYFLGNPLDLENKPDMISCKNEHEFLNKSKSVELTSFLIYLTLMYYIIFVFNMFQVSPPAF